MTGEQARLSELAEGYRQQYVLSQGDRAQRAEAEQFWWTWEAVHEGVTAGTLPVEMLDALLHLGDADAGFRGFVAAGPIEDALRYQAGVYAEAIAARCVADSVWAEAAQGVWLTDVEWAALPSELRRFIAARSTKQSVQSVKAKSGKRPSKRQGKQPRHR